jgi:hypothetical protein
VPPFCPACAEYELVTKVGKGVAAVAGAAVLASQATTAVPRFKNCAMHRKYGNGVRRVDARDHTSGTPSMRTFLRNDKLYAANRALDRDKDGVACEQA